MIVKKRHCNIMNDLELHLKIPIIYVWWQFLYGFYFKCFVYIPCVWRRVSDIFLQFYIMYDVKKNDIQLI